MKALLILLVLFSGAVFSGCALPRLGGVKVNDTIDFLQSMEKWPSQTARNYLGDDVLDMILSSYSDADAAEKIVELLDDELAKRGSDRLTDDNKAWLVEKVKGQLEYLRELLSIEAERNEVE